MYSPVRDFVLCIEDAIHLQPEWVACPSLILLIISHNHLIPLLSSTHCELYHFLQDFVEQRFLDSIAAEYKDKVDAALKRMFKTLLHACTCS